MANNIKLTAMFFSTLVLLGCNQTADLQENITFNNEVSYLTFPSQLSSNSPHDVDIALEHKLQGEKKFAQVQRLFEILAWQNFVALNWPADASGKPLPGIADKGNPVWGQWKESYEVYQTDGSTPLPWGERAPPADFKLSASPAQRILFRTQRNALYGQATVDDEINQAFTGPIWDQNGNMVRYEVLMNESEFTYLVANELYNIDGQIEFSKQGKSLVFPMATREKIGAIELKFAWKIIDQEKDIPSRFFLQQAWVKDTNGLYSNALVGMVGMHIALKTVSSPQWIWATFEHVDNLEANPLLKTEGKTLKPLFYDADCQICPVNISPQLAGDYSQGTIKKNQIQRVLPITKATQDLNTDVQAVLAQNRSVLQYYQLIGTQWPTEPNAKPYPVENHSANNPPALPLAVTNKSGGKPTPVYLTNMVMETYFQGATVTGKGEQFYNTEQGNIQAWHQIQGFKQYGTNSQRIFGTEGCVGCHYSASIASAEKMVKGQRTAIYNTPGSADFSWLVQLKAHFKQ
jgi:hypothetical protein